MLRQRTETFREERNRKLNTPKTENIDELFHRALGIHQISSSWHWRKTSVESARRKLDGFVTLRGNIAHRGVAANTVYKVTVTDYYDLIKRIGAKTGGQVRRHVKAATGVSMVE
jgi:hypothetical protein